MHVGGGGGRGGRVRGGIIRGGAGGEPAQEAGKWSNADVVRVSEAPTRISMQQAANGPVFGRVSRNELGRRQPTPTTSALPRQSVTSQHSRRQQGFWKLTYMDKAILDITITIITAHPGSHSEAGPHPPPVLGRQQCGVGRHVLPSVVFLSSVLLSVLIRSTQCVVMECRRHAAMRKMRRMLLDHSITIWYGEMCALISPGLQSVISRARAAQMLLLHCAPSSLALSCFRGRLECMAADRCGLATVCQQPHHMSQSSVANCLH